MLASVNLNILSKMKLNAYCKECLTKNRIPGDGILTRQDLQIRVGEVIEFNCKKCGIGNRTHINRIFATSSKLTVLICTLIGTMFIIGGLAIKYNNGLSIIWSTGIGGLIISAGLASSNYSNSRVFNKTFI